MIPNLAFPASHPFDLEGWKVGTGGLEKTIGWSRSEVGVEIGKLPRGSATAIVSGSMRGSENENAFPCRHWTLKEGDCQNMEIKALSLSSRQIIFSTGSIVTRRPIRGRCVQSRFAAYPAIPRIHRYRKA